MLVEAFQQLSPRVDERSQPSRRQIGVIEGSGPRSRFWLKGVFGVWSQVAGHGRYAQAEQHAYHGEVPVAPSQKDRAGEKSPVNRTSVRLEPAFQDFSDTTELSLVDSVSRLPF